MLPAGQATSLDLDYVTLADGQFAAFNGRIDTINGGFNVVGVIHVDGRSGGGQIGRPGESRPSSL